MVINLNEDKMLPAERLAKIAELNKEIDKLKNECDHSFRVLSEAETSDRWMSIGATCLGCGEHFGWRCKKSPDGVCHYTSHDGMVTIVNGAEVPVPHYYDEDMEDGESCIFCGMPYERK